MISEMVSKTEANKMLSLENIHKNAEKLISHPALLLFLVFLHSFPSNHPTGVISLYSNVPQDEVLIMVKAFTTKMLEK